MQLNESNESHILSICLEEYRSRINEILKRVELQHSILKMQLALMAAILSATIIFVSRGNPHNYQLSFMLLLAPLPLFFLSWSHANHDFMICANASYLTRNTCSNLKRIIGAVDILRWEEHLANLRNERSQTLPKGLVFGEEYFISLFVPIICSLFSFLLIIIQEIELTQSDEFWSQLLTFLSSPTNIYLNGFSEHKIMLLLALFIQVCLLILNIHLVFYTIRARNAVRLAYATVPS